MGSRVRSHAHVSQTTDACFRDPCAATSNQAASTVTIRGLASPGAVVEDGSVSVNGGAITGIRAFGIFAE